jgi:hypothetical protein
VKYIAAISFVLILYGCDPVKRIQRHDEQMARMEAVMLDRGICRPDTFIIRRTDTLTRTDTVGEIYIYTDTTTLHDTTTITRERIRTVLRTITIRDTMIRQIIDDRALTACRSARQKAENLLADTKQRAQHRGAIIALLSALLLCLLFFALSK